MTTQHQGDQTINSATGEADIDVSAADYTSYQALLTIAPAAGAPLESVEILFDLAKAVTGFGAIAGYAAITLTLALQRKIDGTNWRLENQAILAGITGTNAAATGSKLSVGNVGATEQVRVVVKVTAESSDVEIPYVVYYKGPAPTITAVAA